mmetsp:Transcript_18674/g.53694  ORF Transcript_18674/g.53694 Transcript_18674/m.53694 type:complete len:238 (-) Transcript_18674:538-1251(-)
MDRRKQILRPRLQRSRRRNQEKRAPLRQPKLQPIAKMNPRHFRRQLNPRRQYQQLQSQVPKLQAKHQKSQRRRQYQQPLSQRQPRRLLYQRPLTGQPLILEKIRYSCSLRQLLIQRNSMTLRRRKDAPTNGLPTRIPDSSILAILLSTSATSSPRCTMQRPVTNGRNVSRGRRTMNVAKGCSPMPMLSCQKSPSVPGGTGLEAPATQRVQYERFKYRTTTWWVLCPARLDLSPLSIR